MHNYPSAFAQAAMLNPPVRVSIAVLGQGEPEIWSIGLQYYQGLLIFLDPSQRPGLIVSFTSL